MKLNISMLIVLSTFSMPSYSQSLTPPPSEQAPVTELPGLSLTTIGVDDELPSITTLTRQTLEKAGIQSWHDLGRIEPGLNFEEQNSSINIRGLDRHRVQLFVDGIPNPWLQDGARGTSGGQQSFSFGSLSSIAVLKGTGIKGSGSLGSQVALNSIGFSDLLKDNKSFGFLGGVGYSGYDDSVTTQVGLAAEFSERFRAMLYGSYKDFSEVKNMGGVGGYGTDRTKANPESGHEKNALVRFEVDMSPEHVLGLNASTFRNRSQIDLVDEQNNANYDIGNNTAHERSSSDRVWLTYDYQKQGRHALLDRVSALVYWQDNEISSGYDAYRNYQVDGRAFIIPGNPFGYGNPYGPIGRDNSIRNRSLGGRLEAEGYLGDNDFYSNWLIGIDYQSGRYAQASDGYDNCPSVPFGTPAPFGPRTCDFLHTNQSDVPKVESQDLGFYLQNTFAWYGNKFRVTPMLRYDYWERKPKYAANFADTTGGVSGNESITRSGGRWSPSILIEIKPRQELTLYAQYAHGFRAPSATELYFKYGSIMNYMRMGNADLKPETSRGIELGAAWDDDSINASLVFFHQNYKNFIESNLPIPADSPYAIAQETLGHYPFGVFHTDNLEKARIYGLEAKTEWRFADHWTLQSGLAWTVGKDRENDTHLNSVAPLKGYVGLGYDREQWGANIHLNLVAKRNKVRYKEPTADAPYPDFKAPGYGTVDLGAYWQPKFAKGLHVQVNLINAFDKKHWQALNVPTQGTSALSRDIDYYSSRGRYGMLSLRYEF